ncbi:MAG TPA: type II toxin-antitoxin system VapC family toxin [Rhodoferax sp.]|jgi:ribonuclease VapC|nr:type II toxin-antitoxin system VapC family toxin [Rhodoferax sp.]HPW30736.1 type II toxin-antitoxin system VapC family toxin [Rhodoferax sp.]
MMVLDSSAVLGYLNGEPGTDMVATHILSGQACILAVNQTEVLSKLSDWGMPMEDACAAVAKLALQVIPFTAELAIEAARLRQPTRAQGLSLGDRACLALARQRQCAVLTGDRPWLDLAEALGLQILTFRPATH